MVGGVSMVTETGTGFDTMSNTRESVVRLLFSRRRLQAPGAGRHTR
jgi:hypothetical protein